MRARYTWHLDSPFDKEFDHTHWWGESVKVEPEAALYELARRHPLVCETPPEKIQLPGTSPLAALPSFLEPRPSLRLTQRLGMKSWPELSASERRNWKSSIGVMKGFDFRSKKAMCINVTKLAHSAIIKQREDALRTGRRCAASVGAVCSQIRQITNGKWPSHNKQLKPTDKAMFYWPSPPI